MSDTFFESIDKKLKSILNHPVPALMRQETKKLLQELQTSTGEYNFELDLQKGKNGEKVITNFLLLNGYELIKDNQNIEYDLVFRHKDSQDKNSKFEIKVDFMAADTGNIAIEQKCRGKDSGLNAWNCDFVVYVIPQKSIAGFIKLEKLKTIVKELQDKNIGRVHSNGGDENSNTVNYLMPYQYFETNFKIVSL